MDGDTTERISQEGRGGESSSYGLLERASAFAGGILESVQALAGTTTCKGVQIARLKQWAIENDCWIDDPNNLGVYSDCGSENEILLVDDTGHIFFIDTIIFKADSDGIDTYKKYSPNYLQSKEKHGG